MVRFVLSPEGVVTPDIRRRLPGRGVWIDARRESVAAAGRRAFSRGFRTGASVPDCLADDVADQLRRAALQRLALAQKAGLVTCGFEKVRERLMAGPVAGLVMAADGAQDGRRKLTALAKKARHLHNDRVVDTAFSSAELESTLGRERVVHVALSPGRASDHFFTDALRYTAFESGQPHGADDRKQPDEHMFAGS